MVSGLFDREVPESKSRFYIPGGIIWSERSWTLQSVGLFVGGVDNVHYRSVVMSPEDIQVWRPFDDDHITKMRERAALHTLENNSKGLPYGLVYTQNHI